MQRTITRLATLAFGLGLTSGAAVLSAPTANAAGSSYQGCPYGAVCIYPANSGFNGGHPKYIFYSYTGHNITNEYGTHRVVNNQYGGAAFGLCARSGGKGGLANTGGIEAEGGGSGPFWADFNATPVNSVDLRPFSQYDSLCLR